MIFYQSEAPLVCFVFLNLHSRFRGFNCVISALVSLSTIAGASVITFGHRLAVLLVGHMADSCESVANLAMLRKFRAGLALSPSTAFANRDIKDVSS